MQPSVTVGFEQSFVLYLQGTKKNKKKKAALKTLSMELSEMH